MIVRSLEPAPEPLVQMATTRTVRDAYHDDIVKRSRWCAAAASGAVFCLGDNASGQAGDGTKDPAYRPVTVVGLPAGARAARRPRSSRAASSPRPSRRASSPRTSPWTFRSTSGRPTSRGRRSPPSSSGAPNRRRRLSSARWRRARARSDPTYAETSLVIVRARTDGEFKDVTLECLGGPVPDFRPVGTRGDYEFARVDRSKRGRPGTTSGDPE